MGFGKIIGLGAFFYDRLGRFLKGKIFNSGIFFLSRERFQALFFVGKRGIRVGVLFGRNSVVGDFSNLKVVGFLGKGLKILVVQNGG